MELVSEVEVVVQGQGFWKETWAFFRDIITREYSACFKAESTWEKGVKNLLRVSNCHIAIENVDPFIKKVCSFFECPEPRCFVNCKLPGGTAGLYINWKIYISKKCVKKLKSGGVCAVDGTVLCHELTHHIMEFLSMRANKYIKNLHGEEFVRVENIVLDFAKLHVGV